MYMIICIRHIRHERNIQSAYHLCVRHIFWYSMHSIYSSRTQQTHPQDAPPHTDDMHSIYYTHTHTYTLSIYLSRTQQAHPQGAPPHTDYMHSIYYTHTHTHTLSVYLSRTQHAHPRNTPPPAAQCVCCTDYINEACHK